MLTSWRAKLVFDIRDMAEAEHEAALGKKVSAGGVPADFTLHYPEDYIIHAWQVWRLSNYAVYPNGKAYDDQPKDLLQDFWTLNALYHAQKLDIERDSGEMRIGLG